MITVLRLLLGAGVIIGWAVVLLWLALSVVQIAVVDHTFARPTCVAELGEVAC